MLFEEIIICRLCNTDL